MRHGLRFEFDESFCGTLYAQDDNGDWQAVRTVSGMDQFTDQEWARLMPQPEQAPPAAPPPSPFPDGSREDSEGTALPGQDPELGGPPPLEGYPGEPVSGPIVFESSPNGNTETNRDLAQQRHAQDPSLANPEDLAGTPTPGGGVYGYPNEPRSNEAANGYQEQVTGNPTGLEVNVGGQHIGEGRVVDGVWFDGVRIDFNAAAGSSVPVFIDGKRWESFNESAPFFDRVVQAEVNRQLQVIPDDARVEWVVSNEAAARSIRMSIRRLDSDSVERISIRVQSSHE